MRPSHDHVSAWLRLSWAGACAAVSLAFPLDGRGADNSELGRPFLRYYAPGEHLRGTASYRVTQDAAGLVYFATPRDVLKFDGLRWVPLILPTEVGAIRRFIPSSDGKTYVVGAGVLGYLTGSGWDASYISLADQLPPDVRAEDDFRDGIEFGGEIFFADERHLLRWHDGAFAITPFPCPRGSQGPRFHRVGDALYFSALSRGLWRWTPAGPSLVSDHPSLRESRVISLEADADGNLIALTSHRGFLQLDPDGNVKPLATPMNRWLAGKRVYAAIRLPDGSRAVAFSATSGNGGARFAPDGSYAGPLNSSIGLFVDTVRDFHRDREGGLWLGLTVGVARLEWPSAATFFDSTNGLGTGTVSQVLRHRGVLYAATSEGLFKLLPADDSGRMARFERLRNQEILGLAVVGGELLALTDDALYAVRPEGVQLALRLPAGATRVTPSRRSPGRLWLATSAGVRAVRRTADGWRDEGIVSGLTEPCHTVREASDGALWLALESGGVARLVFAGADALTPTRVQHFAGGDGFAGRVELVDDREELLFAAHGARELRAYQPAENRFVARRELPSPFTGGWFAAGDAGALWHAQQTRVALLSREGATGLTLPHFVTAAIGSATGAWCELDRSSSALWIAGSSGLARVDLSAPFPAPAPFGALLQASGVQANQELPLEHGPVSFRLSAPRLGPAQRVEYRTRLIGRDAAWTEWSTQRERSFAELRPGRYRFVVEARDADGVMGAPAELAFSVHTPWWQTRWAYGGYALLALALVGGIVQLRTRALRRHAAQLEGIIEQRTAELARQNQELVRLHQLEFDEKVSARLAEEKARLETLRYQLNPHFLFNTLVSISASLPAGAATARSMVERLSEFCRLTLHRSDESDWTTLGQEMKLLGAYLAIEQTRWGDLLDTALQCDDGLAPEQLPHFLLLPLVENALKYGRATSPDRVSIRIRASRDPDGALVVTVMNTGEWIEPGDDKSVASLGIGLENLRERLARHYPRAHEFAITHDAGWVTVTLRLTRRSAI